YGFWYDASGHKKCIRFPNCRDKEAARQLLHEHLKQLSYWAAGMDVHPDQKSGEGQVELEVHLQAYLKSLRDRDRGDHHVKSVGRKCRFIFAELGARVLGDLKRERLQTLLEGLQIKTRGRSGPCSARTKESYRVAICAFTAWLSSPNVKRIRA